MAGILEKGPGAADEVRALFDRLQPTLPIVLANLVSLGEVAVTYQPSLEQLLVLLPQGTATTQAIGVAKREHQTGLQGRLPDPQPEPQPAAAMHHRLPAAPAAAGAEPPGLSGPAGRATCTAASRRTRRSTCAVPATCPASPFLANARRRSKMCESNENYIPLNDGYNWKGDPNATLSGQPVPQLPPGSTTCASSSAAGSGAAADSGRRIRPGDRHVRWTGRACVHTVQPGP